MSVYNRRIPTADEIAGNVVKELKRTASGRRAIENFGKQIQVDRQRQQAAKALEDQAAELRQRALDGRVNGLDPEVRALYVRKAEAAEAEARRLSGEERQERIDLARAAELETEAARHDQLAGDMSLPLDVRRYYRDRAIDCRRLAAIHRGEKPEGQPPEGTVGRSARITLPR
jgi:hypothetical protein